MLDDIKAGADLLTKLIPVWGAERIAWQRAQTEIDKELHCRALDLERLFVEPDVSIENPIDHKDFVRNPMFHFIKQFLEPKPAGHNHLIILADAGMGKTSLLAMIRLLARKRSIPFYSGAVQYQALKLGPDTISRLSKLPERSRSVLLLDALDEDPLARGLAFDDRLAKIIETSSDFFRVIITCRTQFFPAANEWRDRNSRVGNFFPKIIHINPFSHAQVRKYLRNKFPGEWWHKFVFYRNHKESFSHSIVEKMKDLKARPLLLSYIEFLADSHLRSGYEIYKEVLEQWFALENRKRRLRKEADIPKIVFWESATLLAVELFTNDVEIISAERMKFLIEEGAKNLKWVYCIRQEDIEGRSIMTKDSNGAFRFAHRSFAEFLVAEHCLAICRFPFGKDRLTDEIRGFFHDAGRKVDANLDL